MAKPRDIELPDGTLVPVVYEDRSVLVVDKPAGWLVAPDDWVATSRNLFLALREGIDAGEWWAASRNLRFLRFVHRLDAETSGLLLCVKSQGAMAAYSRLFEGRQVTKTYFAVVPGSLARAEWVREESIGPDPRRLGRFRFGDSPDAKPAETYFRRLAEGSGVTLLAAWPRTGRTHQIRLHLLAGGTPVLGDELYGQEDRRGLALRAVGLEYADPFTGRMIRVSVSADAFCQRYGLAPVSTRVGSPPWTPAPDSSRAPAPRGQASSRSDRTTGPA